MEHKKKRWYRTRKFSTLHENLIRNGMEVRLTIPAEMGAGLPIGWWERVMKHGKVEFGAGEGSKNGDEKK